VKWFYLSIYIERMTQASFPAVEIRMKTQPCLLSNLKLQDAQRTVLELLGCRAQLLVELRPILQVVLAVLCLDARLG